MVTTSPMETLSAWIIKNRYTSTGFGRALSEHAGLKRTITYQTILNWRKGKSRPTIEMAFEIEKFTKGGVKIGDWK